MPIPILKFFFSFKLVRDRMETRETAAIKLFFLCLEELAAAAFNTKMSLPFISRTHDNDGQSSITAKL